MTNEIQTAINGLGLQQVKEAIAVTKAVIVVAQPEGEQLERLLEKVTVLEDRRRRLEATEDAIARANAALGNAPEGWVEGLWYPAADVENFNPQRFDFHWNADYTEFCPVRLRWFDDASYAAYQADDAAERWERERKERIWEQAQDRVQEIPGGDEEFLF